MRDSLTKIAILIGVVNFIITFAHIIQATKEISEINGKIFECKADIDALRNQRGEYGYR